MTHQQLISEIKNLKSFLCIGLDADVDKLPASVAGNQFEFNRQIIDATWDYTVAYKPNMAFYEVLGTKGWEYLTQTIDYIHAKIAETNSPKLIIADAKRGDIGNTATQYAKAFFNTLKADAITVAPYMGNDTIAPFLAFKDKYTIVLALTSNGGSADYELQTLHTAQKVYEKVIVDNAKPENVNQLMFVVGATNEAYFKHIRSLCPEHFLLVPGVGAQGGSLTDVYNYGANKDIGLLVNASRSIIFASTGSDFAERAGEEAKKLQLEMAFLMSN